MICSARRDADPAAKTCTDAMGGGKAVCACRLAVEAVPVETRVARVPDSAQEEAS